MKVLYRLLPVSSTDRIVDTRQNDHSHRDCPRSSEPHGIGNNPYRYIYMFFGTSDQTILAPPLVINRSNRLEV